MHGLGKWNFGDEVREHFLQDFFCRKTGLLSKDAQILTLGRLLYCQVPDAYALSFCKAFGSLRRLSLSIVSGAFGRPDDLGPDCLLGIRNARHIQHQPARRAVDRGSPCAMRFSSRNRPILNSHPFQCGQDVAGRYFFGSNLYVQGLRHLFTLETI